MQLVEGRLTFQTRTLRKVEIAGFVIGKEEKTKFVNYVSGFLSVHDSR